MSRKKLLFGFVIFVIILKATQLTLISDYQKGLLKEISVSSEKAEEGSTKMQISTAQASYSPMVEQENESYINVTKCQYVGSTKSYMDANKITSVSSRQYQLVYISGLITTNGIGNYVYYDKNGIEHYAVALSSIYGNIGDTFRITLDTGNVIFVIKVEEKADSEVDVCGSHKDGSIIEFVIDKSELDDANFYNDFTGGFQEYDGFQGSIVSIERKEE